MKASAIFGLAVALGWGLSAGTARGQEDAAKKESKDSEKKKEAEIPRTKDGKRLFGAVDVLRIVRVGGPRLSPDGTRIAYTVSAVTTGKDGDAAEKGGDLGKYVSQIWVMPAAGPASAGRQFTRGEKGASNPKWSPDGKLLAFLKEGSEEKDAKPQVWFLYTDGGEAWQATKHKSGVSGYEFSPDGKTLLFVATAPEKPEEEKRKKEKDDAVVVDRDIKMQQLWTWDIASGKENQLTRCDCSASDAKWSPDGAHVSYTTNPTPKADDGGLQTAWVMEAAGGKPHKVDEKQFATHTARWSPDGRWIAFLSRAGDDIYQENLFVIGADGGEARKLTNGFELNAQEPHWAPDSKTIYFSTSERETVEVFAADVAGAAKVKKVTERAGVVQIAQIGANGTVVGTVEDPKQLNELFRSDLHFGAIEPLTNHNAWLAEYALGEVEVVKWKSADGTEIEGVLTKPVGYSGGKAPFLLNPHGGPSGTTLLSFGFSSQVMAANGYLVLQPNFRGSVGRGEKFERANQKDWGNGDYQDDMSGVDFVVKQGWADPQRMGAYGWSYGGYMTMWIDTQTNRFKAISPGAGLSDIYSMYSQNDVPRYLRHYFDEKAPWDNFEEYWAHSPMKFIENVKTPTMILHGQSDTRVPIPQSEEFYRALYERHVPVEYVTYPRENHGFTELRHQVDRTQRYLVFFGKYLNNTPVTEPKEVVERMQKDLP